MKQVEKKNWSYEKFLHNDMLIHEIIILNINQSSNQDMKLAKRYLSTVRYHQWNEAKLQ